MKQVVDINRIFEENSAAIRNRNCAVNYVSVPEDDFNDALVNISGKNVVLIGLFCVEDFNNHPGFSLL